MKLRIHYTIDGVEDHYDIESDSFRAIQDMNVIEMYKRGLNEKKNDCWSEEVK